jgi:hypothetical protein
MQTWKFTYTKETSFKKAVNKNGSLKPGLSKYIITDGKDYTDCLRKAKQEVKFNDKQLIGSRKIE